MSDVLNFIQHFKGARETFLHGCCYWFAMILRERFNDRGYLVDIFHEPVENHFVARFLYLTCDVSFTPRFFDIRGDVTNLYDEDKLENMWIMEFDDQKRYTKLMCDCRDFIEPENYPAWLKNNH